MTPGSRVEGMDAVRGRRHPRRRPLAPRLALLLAALPAEAQAQRALSVDEVQPDWRDEVHTVWPNGPTFSTRLAAPHWPAFAASPGDRCSPTEGERYTGYDDDGQYCKRSSDALDARKHLLLYSGRAGLAFDAAATGGNFLPLLGATYGLDSSEIAAPSKVYASLGAASLKANMSLNCNGIQTRHVLRPIEEEARVGLVRQGHTVSQVLLAGLEWK